MSRYILCALAAAAVAVGALGASARADIITPVACTASSQYSTGVGCAANLIATVQHGSSIAKITQPNLNDPSTWYVNNSDAGWTSSENPKTVDGSMNYIDTWVLFDLGAAATAKTLTKVDIWNYYQYYNGHQLSRDTKTLEIWTSNSSHGDGTLLASVTLNRGTAVPEYGNFITLPPSVTGVEWIKFKMLTTYGPGGQGADYYNDEGGLAFVTFEGVPTPEPGTLALLGASLLGLLCYAWRKRR
jgi:hypothetical protein